LTPSTIRYPPSRIRAPMIANTAVVNVIMGLLSPPPPRTPHRSEVAIAPCPCARARRLLRLYPGALRDLSSRRQSRCTSIDIEIPARAAPATRADRYPATSIWRFAVYCEHRYASELKYRRRVSASHGTRARDVSVRRAQPFAERSLLAHLLKLVREGRARKDDAGRYALA
jgi:hypothetical protein